MTDLRGISGLELLIRILALKAAFAGRSFDVTIDATALASLQDSLASEGVGAQATLHGLDCTVTVGAPQATATPGVAASSPCAASPAPCSPPSAACGQSKVTVAADAAGGLVVFVASDRLGEGDAKLGEILMRSATKVLSGFQPLPSTLIFMNAGVHLTTTQSNLLTDLQAMADAGVEILSCGTCLDFYGLKESLLVGRVSNMVEILGRMASARQVIRL